MTWAIAGDWLAVVGLIFLTFGTGAQALANLAEFKSLQETVSGEVWEALFELARVNRVLEIGDAVMSRGGGVHWWTSVCWTLLRLPTRIRTLRAKLANNTTIPGALLLMPRRLSRLRAKGGDRAVEMARLIRSAQVWAILMIGSAIALVAAAIQLALAYLR